MSKKLFNWMLFIWIMIIGAGICFFIYGIYQSIFFSDGQFALAWFSGDRRSAIALGILGCIVLILLGGLVPLAVHQVHSNAIAFRSSPKLTTQAKVLSKTFETDYSYDSESGSSSKQEQHFIGFEFSDGRRKNFVVGVAQYNTILENEVGILIYKEHKNRLYFVDFQCQA